MTWLSILWPFFFGYYTCVYSYQGHVDGELHSNAHRGDENDHRDSTQLDSHEPHEAKELHSHERQYQHLKGK